MTRAVGTLWTVKFEYVTGCGDYGEVVARSSPRLVGIKTVVTGVPYYYVLGVNCSTEPLNTVVLVGYDFDVLNYGSATYATKGDTVDFVTATDVGSAVTY